MTKEYLPAPANIHTSSPVPLPSNNLFLMVLWRKKNKHMLSGHYKLGLVHIISYHQQDCQADIYMYNLLINLFKFREVCNLPQVTQLLSAGSVTEK